MIAAAANVLATQYTNPNDQPLLRIHKHTSIFYVLWFRTHGPKCLPKHAKIRDSIRNYSRQQLHACQINTNGKLSLWVLYTMWDFLISIGTGNLLILLWTIYVPEWYYGRWKSSIENENNLTVRNLLWLWFVARITSIIRCSLSQFIVFIDITTVQFR